MFSPVEDIIDDIRQGKMVIIVDDEDRENEGDLLMASVHTRPEDINFMARYGRGLICLTLTRSRCERLNLPMMVRDNQEQFSTAFTVSIEAAEGVTTGISAADRAKTIQAAVAPDATAASVVQPGHIFPLMARPGGVLERAGHTEAGCDLARLAGLEPSATIVEILNEDGTMARRPDLEKFAAEHDLKIGTIADLIRYRAQKDPAVERFAETELETAHGKFRLVSYQDQVRHNIHFALVNGAIDSSKPVTVRVHVENIFTDVLGGVYTGEWPFDDALARVAQSEQGVLVVLRSHSDRDSIVREIESRIAQAGRREWTADDDRTSGIGAQILADLGVRDMQLMTAPKIYHGLSGYGLNVQEFITRDDS